MWSYYGAKTNIVHLYPPPKYGKIIEPFAGSARYSLKYFDREVLLVDKYEVIVKIWKWLQLCSPADILGLPRPKRGQTLNEYDLPEEARMLMGFLISKGVESPRTTVTAWVSDQRPNYINFSLKRIASNLFKIKHWEIRLDSYLEINNEKATWFIDPPYQVGGEAYPMSNKDLNFGTLAQWCKDREGQVIVCETKGNWLPFIPLGSHKARVGKQFEVFWTNEPTSYKAKPKELFT